MQLPGGVGAQVSRNHGICGLARREWSRTHLPSRPKPVILNNDKNGYVTNTIDKIQ